MYEEIESFVVWIVIIALAAVGFVTIVSRNHPAPAAVSCQCDDCSCKRGAERD